MYNLNLAMANLDLRHMYTAIMLRKLFCYLAQSKHAPSSSSPPPPAPQVQEHRDSDAVDVVDTWAASLPIDLILEILLRLEPAVVVSCAGVCKPWRRAIISNASILGAHLDRFVCPSLLLGIFRYDRREDCLEYLERTPGLFQSALPSNGGGGTVIPANSLIPAVALPTLLSCKDGFILLTTRSANSLCLCNPVTGYWTIIPAATGRHNTYILLTGSSPSSSSSDDDPAPAVRILAVHRRREHSNIISLDEETLSYQIFSTSGSGSGDWPAWVWSPVVQCSGDELVPGLCVRTDHRRMAVCRDAVYWLAGPGFDITCVFALDVRTGRTWTTELPTKCHLPAPNPEAFSSILATSGDGRLSLMRTLWGPKILVWVLSDDAQWNLHRTISVDAYNILPTGGIPRSIYLSAFCPRSRCVVASWSVQEILIDVDSSGLRPRIMRIGNCKGFQCCPYEIDSTSTCRR